MKWGLACLPLLLSAAQAAEPLAARVAAAARQAVIEQAERDGLQGVEVEAELAALPSTPPSCAEPRIEPVDLRQPAHMRFVLVCPGVGARQLVNVRATLSAEVGVALVALNANQPIAERDVALERRDISTLPDASSDLAELVGMSPRRALRAGQVLQKRMLSAPLLVRRGESVRIVARSGPVEVTNAGEAMDPGRLNETVRVRNSRTGRILRARITGAGEVVPVEMDSNNMAAPDQSRD
ncbi:flagellar basal body P-ring formation chaperone FlgA [Ideonella azotifigens]|uniref:Flagella basal body P-ring formation protein FlgA n=1 Tax=Ideonella azotifigens TaxID=513160 RepID=A0ABN1K964_9BURK|nr:flagellar basal body P-ring formation chaperone FlgA [Ideonella azotifigens]MCD2339100.1 flagellar basal body P-ring formation chaperone FlgA [Ideonella azotifigens]